MMDPATYQQLMVQHLMGGQQPGVGGQNPTSLYGQAFLTGNMGVPPQAGQSVNHNAGMLGSAVPSQYPQQMYPNAG